MKRLRGILLVTSVVTLGATAFACGGKVTFVDDGSGAGGGSASSTSKATTGTSISTNATTGTGKSCTVLKAELDAANAGAQACNPALSSIQCDGSQILVDPCGCSSLLANEKEPAKIAAAKAANQAWLDAGCGPLDCGGGCFPVGPGWCQGQPDGSGICASAVFTD